MKQKIKEQFRDKLKGLQPEMPHQPLENVPPTREVSTHRMGDHEETFFKAFFHSEEEDGITEVPRKTQPLNFIQKLVQDLGRRRQAPEIRIEDYHHVPRWMRNVQVMSHKIIIFKSALIILKP